MYINEAKVKFRNMINEIELFIGIIGFVIFGSTTIYISLERLATPEQYGIMFAIVAINIGLIAVSLLSRRLMGSVIFYARYFEGDLDGIIKPSDMVAVVGKNTSRIESELSSLKVRGYMKNYKLVKKGNETIIELESLVTKCACKNCGAQIDKKVYFTGNCPYCGGIDVFAKEIGR
ncbi:MAG: zinc ribbon domain-containing protein [Clostridia bacterium]|nr:zinc ribbon domain-containing protein [Clostridia bacterium]